MTLPDEPRPSPWEDAGARVAPTLVDACAVLVTGRDVVAAAQAAVGIARAESARRRVAVGDLVGDVPPLVALVGDDDPHGLVDSFLYGISLNRVAHPVAGSDSLFVLPSGTEPVLTEEIFRSDRWRRLAAGFREMGALLLLVAPAGAPGLDALVEMLDGVVVVDDPRGEIGARFPVLATVGAPRAGVPRSGPSAARRTRELGVVRASRASRRDAGDEAGADASAAAPGRSRRGALLALVVVLAIAAGGLAAWWIRERGNPFAVAASPSPAAGSADSTPAAAVPDTAAAAPVPDTLAMVLAPMNPADSATAAAWAIEVSKTNTEEGARGMLEQVPRLPVASGFPMRVGSEPARWYRVMGGGWQTREAADSALAALKAARAVPATAIVMRAPLALLVGSGLGPDSSRARAARYAEAGLPVYALRQPDGTQHLYAGAFETSDQSLFLALALQQLGEVPTLVYRTGRAP